MCAKALKHEHVDVFEGRKASVAGAMEGRWGEGLEDVGRGEYTQWVIAGNSDFVLKATDRS